MPVIPNNEIPEAWFNTLDSISQQLQESLTIIKDHPEFVQRLLDIPTSIVPDAVQILSEGNKWNFSFLGLHQQYDWQGSQLIPNIEALKEIFPAMIARATLEINLSQPPISYWDLLNLDNFERSYKLLLTEQHPITPDLPDMLILGSGVSAQQAVASLFQIVTTSLWVVAAGSYDAYTDLFDDDEYSDIELEEGRLMYQEAEKVSDMIFKLLEIPSGSKIKKFNYVLQGLLYTLTLCIHYPSAMNLLAKKLMETPIVRSKLTPSDENQYYGFPYLFKRTTERLDLARKSLNSIYNAAMDAEIEAAFLADMDQYSHQSDIPEYSHVFMGRYLYDLDKDKLKIFYSSPEPNIQANSLMFSTAQKYMGDEGYEVYGIEMGIRIPVWAKDNNSYNMATIEIASDLESNVDWEVFRDLADVSFKANGLHNAPNLAYTIIVISDLIGKGEYITLSELKYLVDGFSETKDDPSFSTISSQMGVATDYIKSFPEPLQIVFWSIFVLINTPKEDPSMISTYLWEPSFLNEIPFGPVETFMSKMTEASEKVWQSIESSQSSWIEAGSNHELIVKSFYIYFFSYLRLLHNKHMEEPLYHGIHLGSIADPLNIVTQTPNIENDPIWNTLVLPDTDGEFKANAKDYIEKALELEREGKGNIAKEYLKKCNEVLEKPDPNTLTTLQFFQIDNKYVSVFPKAVSELTKVDRLHIDGKIGQLTHLKSKAPINIQYWTSVTTLDIRNVKVLSAEIDFFMRLGEMTWLEDLELLEINNSALGDGNVLVKIPDNWSNLTKLQHLKLSRFEQLDYLPDSIGNLKNLDTLIIRADNFSGVLKELPSTIGGLESLETLYLKNVNLTTLPSSIGSLSKLRSILLYSANDTLQSLPDFNGNVLLEKIRIRGGVMTELPSDMFQNLPKLETFYIGYNKLTTLPETISSAQNLKFLNISYNRISSLPDTIGDLPLIKFDVSENPISQLPYSIVNTLDTLQVLDIGLTSITSLPEPVIKKALEGNLEIGIQTDNEEEWNTNKAIYQYISNMPYQLEEAQSIDSSASAPMSVMESVLKGFEAPQEASGSAFAITKKLVENTKHPEWEYSISKIPIKSGVSFKIVFMDKTNPVQPKTIGIYDLIIHPQASFKDYNMTGSKWGSLDFAKTKTSIQYPVLLANDPNGPNYHIGVNGDNFLIPTAILSIAESHHRFRLFYRLILLGFVLKKYDSTTITSGELTSLGEDNLTDSYVAKVRSMMNSLRILLNGGKETGQANRLTTLNPVWAAFVATVAIFNRYPKLVMVSSNATQAMQEIKKESLQVGKAFAATQQDPPIPESSSPKIIQVELSNNEKGTVYLNAQGSKGRLMYQGFQALGLLDTPEKVSAFATELKKYNDQPMETTLPLYVTNDPEAPIPF